MAKLVGQKRNVLSSIQSKPSQNLNEQIQRLAYQLFVERGYQHGHDAEDWLRAEAIIRKRTNS